MFKNSDVDIQGIKDPNERKKAALEITFNNLFMAQNQDIKECAFKGMAIEMNIKTDDIPAVTGSSSMMIIKNRSVWSEKNSLITRTVMEVFIQYKSRYRHIRGFMYKGNIMNPVLYPWDYDSKGFVYSEPDEIVFDEVAGEAIPHDISRSGFFWSDQRFNEISMSCQSFKNMYNILFNTYMPRGENEPFSGCINAKLIPQLIEFVPNLDKVINDERKTTALIEFTKRVYPALWIRLGSQILDRADFNKVRNYITKRMNTVNEELQRYLLIITLSILDAESNYDYKVIESVSKIMAANMTTRGYNRQRLSRPSVLSLQNNNNNNNNNSNVTLGTSNLRDFTI